MTRYTTRRLASVLILVAALGVFAPTPALAQGVGVKAGWLFSELDFGGSGSGTSESPDTKAGWLAGIFFGGNRRGTVGVQGEILYGKKSGEIANSALDIYVLEIPVMLRVNAGSSSVNSVNVFGVAGPSFDIRLRSKLDDVDIRDDIESYDIGFVAGGGVEIARVVLEARYMRGLRNIAKNLGSVSEIKTTAWAVLVGFRFN